MQPKLRIAAQLLPKKSRPGPMREVTLVTRWAILPTGATIAGPTLPPFLLACWPACPLPAEYEDDACQKENVCMTRKQRNPSPNTQLRRPGLNIPLNGPAGPRGKFRALHGFSCMASTGFISAGDRCRVSVEDFFGRDDLCFVIALPSNLTARALPHNF